jgi:hypothetical protein
MQRHCRALPGVSVDSSEAKRTVIVLSFRHRRSPTLLLGKPLLDARRRLDGPGDARRMHVGTVSLPNVVRGKVRDLLLPRLGRRLRKAACHALVEVRRVRKLWGLAL